MTDSLKISLLHSRYLRGKNGIFSLLMSWIPKSFSIIMDSNFLERHAPITFRIRFLLMLVPVMEIQLLCFRSIIHQKSMRLNHQSIIWRFIKRLCIKIQFRLNCMKFFKWDWVKKTKQLRLQILKIPEILCAMPERICAKLSALMILCGTKRETSDS